MPESLRLVTIVVQRKRGQKVLDAALAAGASGATYFYAQGTGVRERLGFLGRFIEAEKQVILVVANAERACQVLDAARVAGELDNPGSGFAYVQDVSDVAGFFPAATT